MGKGMTNGSATEYIFQNVRKKLLNWNLECIESVKVHSGAFVNVQYLSYLIRWEVV